LRSLVIFILSLFSLNQLYCQNNVEFERIDEILSNPLSEIDIHFFDSLLLEYPESDYLLGMKASYISSNFDSNEADKFLRSSSAVDVESSYVNMARGIIAVDQGRLNDSKSYFERAYSLDSLKRNKWVRVELFSLYQELGLKNGGKFVEEALLIDPVFFNAKVALIYSLDLSLDCNRIINLFKSINSKWLNYQDYSTLGYAHYYCGDYLLAEDAFKRSNVYHENAPAYLGLGNIALDYRKNLELARSLYLKVIEFPEFEFDGIVALGWLHLWMAETSIAEDYFILLTTKYECQDSFNELILFRLKTNDYDQAQIDNLRSIELFGTNYFNFGYSIILDSLKDGDIYADFTSIVNEYKDSFGDDAYRWLLSTLKSLI